MKIEKIASITNAYMKNDIDGMREAAEKLYSVAAQIYPLPDYDAVLRYLTTDGRPEAIPSLPQGAATPGHITSYAIGCMTRYKGTCYARIVTSENRAVEVGGLCTVVFFRTGYRNASAVEPHTLLGRLSHMHPSVKVTVSYESCKSVTGRPSDTIF